MSTVQQSFFFFLDRYKGIEANVYISLVYMSVCMYACNYVGVVGNMTLES